MSQQPVLIVAVRVLLMLVLALGLAGVVTGVLLKLRRRRARVGFEVMPAIPVEQKEQG